jgi:hypothetical protein
MVIDGSALAREQTKEKESRPVGGVVYLTIPRDHLVKKEILLGLGR